MPVASDGSLGIVSPHLDDAVLSCGRLLAAHPGAEVVTVFSCGPERVDPLPWWDQMCGVFRPGDDVTAVRRGEDVEALALSGARGQHLGFWDEQYRAVAPVRLARLRPGATRRRQAQGDDAELAERIERALCAVVSGSGASTWLIPLGLHRGDHELVAGASLHLVRDLPGTRWVLYEELPYRVESPDTVDRALRQVQDLGYTVTDVRLELDPAPDKKAAMVGCHRSQLRALGDRVRMAVEGDEVYHQISFAGATGS